MFKEQRGKWHWILREAGILDSWFDNYQNLVKSHAVKSNPVRTVFHYDDYFIKLDRPEKILHKLRSRWRSKAQIEFEIALTLEQASVPVVKHLGWGQCGDASMLLTRAFPHSVTVMDYWLKSFVYGKADPTTFLEHFGRFLQTFFAANCYHPDFHTGNILYDPYSNKFALVDLYGIKADNRPLTQAELLKMYGIITCLRTVVSDTEAIAFIKKFKFKLDNKSPESLWQQLLEREISRIKAEWPKRKRQIIAEYDKFITRCDDKNGKYLFRNNQNRQPYIKAELPLNTIAPKLYPLNLPSAEAERRWVAAFLNDFLGNEQNMPLVWYQPYDSPNSILYFLK